MTKFKLTFKTPDVIDQVVGYGVDEDLAEKYKSMASLFVKYGEYVTIEIT